MEIEEQPKLRFLGVDVFYVNFSSFKPSFNVDKKVDLSIAPRVSFPKDNPRIFTILMKVSLKLEGYFELALAAVGTFESSEDITPELKSTFINQNAPAIMFPYIRGFVTNFTASLGNVTGPLIIPTQFFRGQVEEYKMEETPPQ